ncbi:hypothetical protein [Cellulomonas soli]
MEQLRELLREAAARRRAAVDRLEADVAAGARRILEVVPTPPSTGRGRQAAPPVEALVSACEVAAGVPVVVGAVRAAAARDGRAATGWPPVRWVHRVRADPLRRLHLRRGAPLDAATVRTGLRVPSPAAPSAPADRTAPGGAGGGDATGARVSRARVSDALRTYVATALVGAPAPWVEAARANARVDELPDALDQAVAGTMLLPAREPRWWRALGALQWVLLAAAVTGLLWLAALAVLGYLRLPEPAIPQWGGVPVPTALALGGVLAGLLLAALGGVLAGAGARRRATAAHRRLRAAVAEVVHVRLVAPVVAESDRWHTCRSSAERAAGAVRRTYDPRGAR